MKRILLRIGILVFLFAMLQSFSTVWAEGDYMVRLRDALPLTLSQEGDMPFQVVSQEDHLYLVDEETALSLKGEEGVLFVEKGQPLTLFSLPTPNDIQFSSQWNLPMIQMPEAWGWRLDGKAARVAVIDSGVIPTHPELSGRIVATKNYTSSDPNDIIDENEHGVAVAGIIGAATNNQTGISGICAAELVCLRVYCPESSNTLYLSQAIYDAVDVYKCDVINISLGYVGESESVELAVKHAMDAGVIVVAAAGNTSSAVNPTHTIRNPAGYEGVIGVGGVDKEKAHVSSSVANTTVDVCAPGYRIYATLADGTCGYLASGTGQGITGTSFATPHVSAAAAIAKSIDPALTPAEFLSLLEQTSVDLGEAEYDVKYGYGLLNVAGIAEALSKEQKLIQLSRLFADETGNFTALCRNFLGMPQCAQVFWVENNGPFLADVTVKRDVPLPENTPVSLTLSKAFSLHTDMRLLLLRDMESLFPLCE